MRAGFVGLPAVVFVAALVAPAHPATFNVNTTDDGADASAGDGACETAPGGGVCTVRAAFEEANALLGPDAVVIPAGTYPVTSPLPIVSDDLSVTGSNGLAELPAVQVIGAIVSLSGLRVHVTNGLPNGSSAGTLVVTDCEIRLLSYQGSVVVQRSTVTIELGIGQFDIRDSTLEGVANFVTNELTLVNILNNIGGVSITVEGSTLFATDVTLGALVCSSGGSRPTCVGGSNNGMTCSSQAECPDGRCVGVTCLLNRSHVVGDIHFGGLFGAFLLIVDGEVQGSIMGSGDGAVSVIRSSVAGVRGVGVGVSIVDSLVSGSDGPGVSVDLATNSAIINGTTITGNAGHGIEWLGQEFALFVVNSTLVANGGAGIYTKGQAEISNATIVGNGGGGLVVVPPDPGSAVATVRNSILAGNVDAADLPRDCEGTLTSAGYNLIQTTIGCVVAGDGTGNLEGVDPLLAPLGDAGGPAPILPLGPGSPAIDAGNPAGCTEPVCTLGQPPPCDVTAPLVRDQRGAPRPFPLDGRCDIGAHETGCGNAFPDPGEACDDGNLVDDDCCSTACEATTSACDDGDVCTLGEMCSAGTCGGGTRRICEPCEVCEPITGCMLPTAPSCIAGDAFLLLKNGGSPERDTLRIKWKSNTPLALTDFGDPTTTTDVALCVIDGTGETAARKLGLTAPHDGDCEGVPCWERSAVAYRYRDGAREAGGLRRLLLKSGKAGKITARASGVTLGLPPLSLMPPVTVRVQRSDAPMCWEATFSNPKANDAMVFRGRSD